MKKGNKKYTDSGDLLQKLYLQKSKICRVKSMFLQHQWHLQNESVQVVARMSDKTTHQQNQIFNKSVEIWTVSLFPLHVFYSSQLLVRCGNQREEVLQEFSQEAGKLLKMMPQRKALNPEPCEQNDAQDASDRSVGKLKVSSPASWKKILLDRTSSLPPSINQMSVRNVSESCHFKHV